ncbi:hypothetical protein JTE90_024013 [Oedothorax gibbosus]|uniref:Uncharacterized protein n=1 Tax=Oedothorax gibbosus TaxID=931172 RepID=A0AAV6VA76_9ARAC|nr:hypothetical protein JTE90_024013 [Oedothorax gibbosus]
MSPPPTLTPPNKLLDSRASTNVFFGFLDNIWYTTFFLLYEDFYNDEPATNPLLHQTNFSIVEQKQPQSQFDKQIKRSPVPERIQ